MPLVRIVVQLQVAQELWQAQVCREEVYRGPDILIASDLSLNGCVPKPHLWGVYPIPAKSFLFIVEWTFLLKLRAESGHLLNQELPAYPGLTLIRYLGC